MFFRALPAPARPGATTANAAGIVIAEPRPRGATEILCASQPAGATIQPIRMFP